MKKIYLSLLISMVVFGIFVLPLRAQNKSGKDDIKTKTDEQLIKDFVSNDWGNKVVPAKRELESRQAKIIPKIIDLLDTDKQVTLKNTWDLVYPGAEKFYGHGWVLDYDVDWISVRTGWLLEELTFQDFGFHERVIDHDEILMTVIKGKSASYITDLQARLKGQDDRKKSRLLAIEKAKNWWQEAKKPWSRLDALLEALKSNSVTRQNDAIHWIRFGETKCDGLTQEVYETIVVSETDKLKETADKSIREQIDEIPDWKLFSRIHDRK